MKKKKKCIFHLFYGFSPSLPQWWGDGDINKRQSQQCVSHRLLGDSSALSKHWRLEHGAWEGWGALGVCAGEDRVTGSRRSCGGPFGGEELWRGEEVKVEDEAWGGGERDDASLAAAAACEQVERTQKGPWASHSCSRIWSWMLLSWTWVSTESVIELFNNMGHSYLPNTNGLHYY